MARPATGRMAVEKINMVDSMALMSRKLGVWFFASTFLYFILSSLLLDFGFLPEYGIVIFFGSLLFFGLSFLPPRLERRRPVNWLMFVSFMLISLGGGAGFTMVFVFGHPSSGGPVTAGAISFMLGILLMIAAGSYDDPTRNPAGGGGGGGEMSGADNKIDGAEG
jgi:hypothetical protein